MESKLEGYRKTKRRQALLNDFKDRFYNMVSFQQVRVEEKASHVIVEADNVLSTDVDEKHVTEVSGSSLLIYTKPDTTIPDPELSDNEIEQPLEKPEKKTRSLLTYVTYLVYFLFWATLYAIAIELRFGVVFLMFSALFGIYFSTRTRKAPGEVSAYSVFNKNCEAIDGTLKAEQFEREIGIRH